MPLTPRLARLTRQHKDSAILPTWKYVWQIPRPINLMPCVVIQCIRGTWVARTIETSVITWHKTQDSTLNIYRRPNPNLQHIRCLCVAVSLYSAIQAVVLGIRMTKKGWSNPYTGLSIPWGFQESDNPRFRNSQRIIVVTLSVLRIGRLYSPRNYSCFSFLLETRRP